MPTQLAAARRYLRQTLLSNFGLCIRHTAMLNDTLGKLPTTTIVARPVPGFAVASSPTADTHTASSLPNNPSYPWHSACLEHKSNEPSTGTKLLSICHRLAEQRHSSGSVARTSFYWPEHLQW